MLFPVRCPYCFQPTDVDVDVVVDGPRQELVSDCEVCCNPMSIVAHMPRSDALVDESLDALDPVLEVERAQ